MGMTQWVISGTVLVLALVFMDIVSQWQFDANTSTNTKPIFIGIGYSVFTISFSCNS